MVMERDFTLGDKHNGTLETYIILLTNVTPLNLIKKQSMQYVALTN